jgi:hypothetical protein
LAAGVSYAGIVDQHLWAAGGLEQRRNGVGRRNGVQLVREHQQRLLEALDNHVGQQVGV